ncbi:MAG: 3'-5' exonuclease [Clostridia bacterium]|nr:3'-5' exonuclease [Clostridia bacterium]
MNQNKLKKLRQEILTTEFSNMNDSQREAIFADEGPLLILAGAGTGKTTVVINKIAYLLKYGNVYHRDNFSHNLTEEDIQFLNEIKNDKNKIEENSETVKNLLSYKAIMPYRILAITFTNKAANEIKDRLSSKLGNDVASEIWAGTFHGICGRILRRFADRIGYNSNFDIYDTNDQKKVIKDCLKEKNLDSFFKPFEVLKVISKAKDNLLSADEFEASCKEKKSDFHNETDLTIAEIYKIYESKLRKANAMDFDDMIMLTVKLFKENSDVLDYYSNKFLQIFIDEYQDTNYAQYELAYLLSKCHGNITVVGDDDQSIYKFRGAVIENILNFEDRFKNAKKIKLERNYRSVKNILAAANSLISKNENRHDKKLWTSFEEGDLITYKTLSDESEEADFICETIENLISDGKNANDIAVFYRTNAQSNPIERELVRRGIPYKIVGGHKFYERKEIKDITSYLSVITNTNDDTRLIRIVNVPKRGIGKMSMSKIEKSASDHDKSLFEIMENVKSDNINKFVELIYSLQKDYETLSLDDFFESLLTKTGYIKMLKEKDENFDERLENIKELKSSIVRYFDENDDADLSNFLREVALLSDIDSFNESENSVVLMTLHASKGLEFDTVFMTGMENNIFPGEKNMYTTQSREEERRLAYVGITRVKKKLYMTNAMNRMIYGKTTSSLPSIFISEIDPRLISDLSKETGDFNKYNSSENVPKTFKVLRYNERFKNKKEKTKANVSYAVGEQISHKTFGKGVILNVEKMGNDSLLEIAFDNVGVKKIMANYARLEKL